MEDPKDVQIAGFRKQMELAERVKKPVVIHTREALQDTLDVLKDYKNVGGILHCYPGSLEAAKPFLDRYYLGIGGTLTFKNNKKDEGACEGVAFGKNCSGNRLSVFDTCAFSRETE